MMSPEHCLKLESWHSPQNINKMKQYEIEFSSKVSLFIQFIQ